MALVAWYPLISNMNNQGIGDTDLTVTSTPTFVSGLIGGALQGGGAAKWTATQTANVLNNTAMSFAFWVYPDAETGNTSARARFFGNDSPRHYSIFQYPTCNDLHWDWRNNAGNTVLGGVLSGVLPSYKWTHVCITYQNPSFKIYINGQREYSTSGGVLDVQNYANETPVILACAGRKLCDYRIYNHCLSPKEVEILARGLVLHYPMTGNVGLPNLLRNSFDLSKWGKESGVACAYDGTKGMYNVTTTQTSSRWGIFQDLDVSPNTTYTFSCDMDGNGTGAGLKFYTDTISVWPGNQITLSNGDHGKKYVTLTTDSTQNKCRLYLNLTVATTTSGWYRCPKLEVGSVATPWTPNTTDSVYESLNYNSTIEYDVSGYNFHGTKIGSPTYSSDTPKYSISTSFNGVDDCIQVPLNTFFPNAGSFTINLWFKKHELGSKNYETVFGGISGFEMDTRNSSSTTLSYYVTGNNRGLTVQSPLNFDTWYMLTMVCDGTNELYYLNGEYKTQIAKKSMPTGNYFIGAWNSATQQNFKGLVSDFRVYATALSSTQVAELYNTSASIANNGTLLAYEFTEN